MIEITSIQKKLSEAIKQSGLTQTEIAKKIGVTQSAIAHYIKGDIVPSLDTFATLCVILDLDANDILGTGQTESERIKTTQLSNAKIESEFEKMRSAEQNARAEG